MVNITSMSAAMNTIASPAPSQAPSGSAASAGTGNVGFRTTQMYVLWRCASTTEVGNTADPPCSRARGLAKVKREVPRSEASASIVLQRAGCSRLTIDIPPDPQQGLKGLSPFERVKRAAAEAGPAHREVARQPTTGVEGAQPRRASEANDNGSRPRSAKPPTSPQQGLKGLRPFERAKRATTEAGPVQRSRPPAHNRG
jgi:hypothetical protein